jgi:adenosylcobinamide kinase/adenosylcobinamide-phosphate guanylyltransferase
MGEVILITGGAKSGKSLFAERLAGAFGSDVVYVATAEILDGEMEERVARHRARRPAAWTTVEAPSDLQDALAVVPPSAGVVLVDCLTIWTSNWLLALGEPDSAEWWDAIDTLQERLFEHLGAISAKARAAPWHLVMVTNEVGNSVVPDTPLGRAFRDLLGAVNQRAGMLSDAMFLVVAGVGTELKRTAVEPGEYARMVKSRYQASVSSNERSSDGQNS